MADLSLNFSSVARGTQSYGDLSMANGRLSLTSDAQLGGTDVVAQRIATRLRLFLTEYFLDTGAGVPYLQAVLRQGYVPADIDAVFIDLILGTPGVAVLSDYSASIDRAHRRLSVSFSVIGQDNVTRTAVVPLPAPAASP